ncbi:hypothetical protein ACHAXA_001309 [Cyclostephanos tholiformis]|uniref:Delta(14)-sterol reductase ERG24 n=1 Tax=Cyclostephanos tholiformis TaxID=382380 RepID=A0ABD3R4V0_9STRA
MRLNPNDRFAKHPTPIERHPPPSSSSSSSSSSFRGPGAMVGKGKSEGSESRQTSSSASASSTSTSASTFEYEFGGPIGAFLTLISLPIIILLLTHWTSKGGIFWGDIIDLLVGRPSPSYSSTVTKSSSSSFKTRFAYFLCPACDDHDEPMIELMKCALVVLSWFIFQVILERVLPCELVEGAPLPRHHGGEGGESTRRLTYRINGHLAFWITLLLLDVGWPSWTDVVVVVEGGGGGGGGGYRQLRGILGRIFGPGGTGGGHSSITFTKMTRTVLTFGRAPLTWLCDRYAMLAFVTIVYAIFLSTYLYAKSFFRDDVNDEGEGGKSAGPLLAAGGNSGNHVYDYFMGRELNPRSLGGTFDWKEFCELRPGLMGWMVLNMAMLMRQRERLGYVTGSMMLVNIFQGAYVWDALYQERAILTTMDITTDGFGYMLVFGDLAWVPFTYSLQARYLVDHDPLLSWPALAAIVAVNATGYLIFRGANGQKDAFRRDPDSAEVSHLTYLRTMRGTRLLTSGWWGLARKINYTGDWIMGLSWCMLCGFDSVVPYFYAIYFAILLVHRSVRDDHMCREKYGDDWDKYRSMVPYRFIPGII